MHLKVVLLNMDVLGLMYFALAYILFYSKMLLESTLPVKDISLSTDFDVSWPTTRLYPSIKPLTFRKIPSTDMISSKGITSTTKKPVSHDLGKTKIHLIL